MFTQENLGLIDFLNARKDESKNKDVTAIKVAKEQGPDGLVIWIDDELLGRMPSS